MNERLANRVYPTILYVLDLLDRIYGRKPGGPPDPKEEFPRLKQYLGQLDSGKSTKEDDLSKAALVYWIDEVLVNSPWPHANHWKDNTLEREFFDARDRAWEFFEKAKIARTLSPPDALEAFYLSVALGFLGVYREGQKKAPAPPTRPTAPPAKAPAKAPAPPQARKPMDSWFGEKQAQNESDDWSLTNAGQAAPPPKEPEGDDLIDESVFGAKPGVSSKGMDLPATLAEWASPVYAQIVPGRQRSFIPQAPADSPHEARPLSGLASLQRSLIAFFWALLVTLALGIMVVVNRYA